jgi:uncharacterized protein
MHLGFVVWLLVVSFGASTIGGVLGMASGIFIVPILTWWGAVDIHAAIPASLVSVIACSCGSAGTFLDSGFTNIRLAIVLETATTFGAVTGFLLLGRVPTPVLFLLFAAILILSACQMLARRHEDGHLHATGDAATAIDASSRWPAALQLDASYSDPFSRVEVPYQVRRVGLGMVLMYGAGMISALLGIGSGVLKIPAMDTALRLPMKVSSATSNFMIGVTASASAGAYFLKGAMLPALAGPVALGSVLGAVVGARLLLWVRVAFGIVLILLAVQMCFAAVHADRLAAGR